MIDIWPRSWLNLTMQGMFREFWHQCMVNTIDLILFVNNSFSSVEWYPTWLINQEHELFFLKSYPFWYHYMSKNCLLSTDKEIFYFTNSLSCAWYVWLSGDENELIGNLITSWCISKHLNIFFTADHVGFPLPNRYNLAQMGNLEAISLRASRNRSLHFSSFLSFSIVHLPPRNLPWNICQNFKPIRVEIRQIVSKSPNAAIAGCQILLLIFVFLLSVLHFAWILLHIKSLSLGLYARSSG